MIYVVFEILKIIGWIIVFLLTIRYRKFIRVDFFWLKIMSAILMAMGGVEDLITNQILGIKSFWWFLGNVCVIITYLYLIKKDVVTFKDVEKLRAQTKSDIKKLNSLYNENKQEL